MTQTTTTPKDAICVVDDNGVEINIIADVSAPQHNVGSLISLISAEMVIAGKGVDILPLLNQEQKNYLLELYADEIR